MIESYKSEIDEWLNLPIWDRRQATRFPIEIELQCRFGARLREVVHGQTVNISSSGILIRTNSRPVRGSRIHSGTRLASVAGQSDTTAVFVEGVVRVDGDMVAIVFRRVEFRTAGAGAGVTGAKK